MSARGDLVVGVDIGGTKTAILVCDRGGGVRARLVASTAVGAPERAAKAIAELVVTALGEAGAAPDDVAALGIGVPGRVEPERGHVTLAVNLDWHDLPLGARLEAILGIPVVVENDVRAAALGLHRRGQFGAARSLALLAIGTGIAAGVVLDGALHRGSHGLAGEIGHVVFEADGAPCACGNRGCLETVAAGPALVRRTLAGWAAEGDGDRSSAGASARGADGGTVAAAVAAPAATMTDRALEGGADAVFAAAARGDPVARDVVEASGRAVAWGIHLLALAYDVERIVIGGGVSHAGEAFMAPVRRELDRFRAVSPLAAEVLQPNLVQLLPAGADAGAWGAVTIALESLEQTESPLIERRRRER